jgi:hypothetical protein
MIGEVAEWLNSVHHNEGVWGTSGIAPRILKLVTRCRLVVRFTPWEL